MRPFTEYILPLLSLDPVLKAEAHTGKSYLEDKKTADLSVSYSITNMADKDALLWFAGDTHYSKSAKKVLGAMQRLGFTIVYEKEFEFKMGELDKESNLLKDLLDIMEETKKLSVVLDKFYILFSKQFGLLATLETFNGQQVINNLIIYCNWFNNKNLDQIPFLVDGIFHNSNVKNEWLFSGNFDGKEGLCARLDYLNENGKFLPQWEVIPDIILLTYEEKKENDKEKNREITLERIKGLPEDAKIMMGIKT